MSTRQDKSLHDACAKGHLRKVREILQKNTDITSRLDQRIGFLGYTPLHEAACQGHDDILELLIIYGGNVDAMANGNYTPLHIAASMDYVKCIKVCFSLMVALQASSTVS
jgi:ankyrin repeat protein